MFAVLAPTQTSEVLKEIRPQIAWIPQTRNRLEWQCFLVLCPRGMEQIPLSCYRSGWCFSWQLWWKENKIEIENELSQWPGEFQQKGVIHDGGSKTLAWNQFYRLPCSALSIGRLLHDWQWIFEPENSVTLDGNRSRYLSPWHQVRNVITWGLKHNALLRDGSMAFLGSWVVVYQEHSEFPDTLIETQAKILSHGK